jgi:hypothetical protein
MTMNKTQNKNDKRKTEKGNQKMCVVVGSIVSLSGFSVRLRFLEGFGFWQCSWWHNILEGTLFFN